MITSKSSQRRLIAIDSTRSVTHGAKRFIKNLLDGLIGYTDLVIILFVDNENFDSYESERVQIIRIRMNQGYILRTLNTILFIPILARWHSAILLYSPWDIGPIIKLLPFVLGIHNPNSVTPRKHRGIKADLIHEFLSKIAAKKATAVEFPSKSAAQAIGDHLNIKCEKQNVIYHGAEVSRWKNRLNQMKLFKSEKNLGEYFIFWSWFYTTKNITTLMLAFSQFISMHKSPENIKLVFVGNFAYQWYKNEVISLVENLGLSEKIIFIENVGDDELVELIYHAKVMVNPSLYETFGFMYVEGRVFNKPFIVADTAVAREVTEGQCIYFKGEDASDLASKMMMAVNKSNLSMDYQIADVFHEEHSAKNLANFFNKML